MDQTPNLELPFIMAAQAQKHITHNEALRILDALVQPAVVARDLATPPGSPNDGDRYIVAAGASGSWAGHTNDIAAWQDGAWAFFAPQVGWTAWVNEEAKLRAWDGSAWVGVVEASLNPTPLVGVNATADAGNRLAVSSPATLLGHEGAGHQLKINKNAASDTASVLLQTNFSGRAEVGTCGDDDLHIKVSANGSAWREALIIDKDTAEIVAAASSATATPLSLMEAVSQAAALLCLAASTGPLLERPVSKSLNAVNWRQLVNQNAFTDGSGVGGENYNNEVMAIGWNKSGTIGVRDVAGYPAFYDAWEHKYHVAGTGKYWTERHVATQTDTSGTGHRPFSIAQAHDGSESLGLFALDKFTWFTYASHVAKLQWEVINNLAYIGDGTNPFVLKFLKNDAHVLHQRNAAGTDWLPLPYFNGSDALQITGRIVAGGPAPTNGVGAHFSFTGAPGNGSTIAAFDANTAATNANITVLGGSANTNWNASLGIRNLSTASGSAAICIVESDAAAGAAYTRWRKSDASVNWAAGKDGNGDFFISNFDPTTTRALTINKTNFNCIFTAPPKLPSYTVAGVPSAATFGAGSLIYVSDESGGAVPAVSDGTNWRRLTDRAVVS